MRLKSLGAVFVVMGLASLATTFAACGSSDDSTPAAGDVTDGSADDGSADGFISPLGDGSTLADGATCKGGGQACAASAECCSASCDAKTGLCAGVTSSCKTAAEACSSATECCSRACVGGKCSAALCTSDGQDCTSGDQCCGGVCSATGDGGTSKCAPLNSSCRTAGNTCAANADCCSKVCTNGVCNGTPSFCTQTGDACATDAECCGGQCNKASGAALGVCEVASATGATNCLVAGQVCSGGTTDGGLPQCGGECCSRACGPYGPTGVTVCQPPSGCRPTGETCRDGKDCCGFGGVQNVTGVGTCSKSAGASTGRCDNGNACRPAGAICKLATTSCNAENNCCAGNVNQNPMVCQQDLLGIPRCTMQKGGTDCSDAGSKVGEACATSVDCCGLPCVPNSASNGPAFICGGTCVATGGACTTSGDCCPGIPCAALPGSTSGICGGQILVDGGVGGGIVDAGFFDAAPPVGSGGCSYSGQVCGSDGDCCSGLSCTSGRCQVYLK